VRLSGFTLKGPRRQGTGLAHGILQVFGGEDVTIEDVTALDSDADGIVVADARRVVIRGCRARAHLEVGAVPVALRGRRSSPTTSSRTGTGHVTAQGAVVGTGIQLSSSHRRHLHGQRRAARHRRRDPVRRELDRRRPTGCAIVANRVSEWRNAANPDVSCGIRLQNSAAEHLTRTLVSANTIERCGVHGIYVENQDGVSLLGNAVLASDRSSICISTFARHAGARQRRARARRGAHRQPGRLAPDQRRRRRARAGQPHRIARDGRPTRRPVIDQSSGGGHSIEPARAPGAAPARRRPVVARRRRVELRARRRPRRWSGSARARGRRACWRRALGTSRHVRVDTLQLRSPPSGRTNAASSRAKRSGTSSIGKCPTPSSISMLNCGVVPLAAASSLVSPC
jgi:hypothetical protein